MLENGLGILGELVFLSQYIKSYKSLSYSLYPQLSATFWTGDNIKHKIYWKLNFCKWKTMAVKWGWRNIGGGGQIIEGRLYAKLEGMNEPTSSDSSYSDNPDYMRYFPCTESFVVFVVLIKEKMDSFWISHEFFLCIYQNNQPPKLQIKPICYNTLIKHSNSFKAQQSIKLTQIVNFHL